MGQNRMGPPQQLVLALRDHFKLGHFVETGTFHGETAAWAALHFPRVITIELSDTYYQAARARFSGQAAVRPLLGNSATVLRELVPTLPGASLFWLDAHWSGLDTAGREAECPVLSEIDIINSSQLDHVILVDDARLFCAPPHKPHRADHWPDLLATTAALASQGRRHVSLFEDVFIAVPSAERGFAVDLLQSEVTAAREQKGRRGWWKRLLE